MKKSVFEEKKLKWEEHFRKQKESGLSIMAWCRHNQISKSTFISWRDQLFPKDEVTRDCFTELKDTQATGVSIEYQGIKVFLEKNFDLSTFKSCLSVLRGALC